MCSKLNQFIYAETATGAVLGDSYVQVLFLFMQKFMKVNKLLQKSVCVETLSWTYKIKVHITQVLHMKIIIT